MRHITIDFDTSKTKRWDESASDDVRRELAEIMDSALKRAQAGAWVASRYKQEHLMLRCQVNNPESAKQILKQALKHHWIFACLVDIRVN